MADVSDVDYDFMYGDNKSDFYFYAYDHPFWRKHEVEHAKTITRFLSSNITLGPKPDIFELNKQKCLVFSPLFIIIGCIMVFGALCNITVCYIYRCRSRRASSNFFVIFFAIFDLFGCLVGIPLEVSSLTLPFMYNVVPLCKIMGCVKCWLVICQCLTLLCVALDCHGKICHPERDSNVKKAKLYCVVAVILAMFVSLPALAVFSTKPVRTPYNEIFGVSCSTDSTEVEWVRILYYMSVLGTFVVSLCAITGLYGLIYVTWYKQRQGEETGEKSSPVKREFPKQHRFVRQHTISSCVSNYGEDICRLHNGRRSLYCSFLAHSDPVHIQQQSKRERKTNNRSNSEIKTFGQSRSGNMTGSKSNSGNKANNQSNSGNKSNHQSNNGNKSNHQSNSGNKSNHQSNSGNKSNHQGNSGIKSRHQNNRRNKIGDQNNIGSNTNNLHPCSGHLTMSSVQLHAKNNRHALMFTVISVVFVVNMLPFVVVTILCATTTVFSSFSSHTSEIMFHFCARSYLFNYLVKPITYMLLNANFRKEIQHICNKYKTHFTHRDAACVGTSCKKLQRLSGEGPLRSTLQSTVYRPPRSPT